MNDSMTSCNIWVSVLFHECQMVIELPGGGGESGGLGGSSVGVGPAVPARGVGEANWDGMGDDVPRAALVGVTERRGVRVGRGVLVDGPGYAADVLVNTGPG